MLSHCRVSKAHLSIALVLPVLLGLLTSPSQSVGQQLSFTTQSARADYHAQPLGRDFLFTMAKNYDDQPGKYYALYATSDRNTLAHLQLTNASEMSLPIKAGQVATFMIPLSWEVKTSGVVENKGIHIWSDDADLAVYLMSHNPYTSDGTQILPKYSWGTDYVVAAYGSLYDGGSFVYDYPSEFCVFADADNTLVTITPSQDIRVSGQATQVLHPKGKSFTESMNTGQVVQYQLVQAQNTEDYDVTGTVIHSSKPVGVIGASTCPNIPADFPYCDHVCEMLPPVRTWGSRYYTAPFIDRKGGDTFLVIGSADNQIIYIADSANGGRPYTTLANKGDHYWRNDIANASMWSSDEPFLLMQYINSATWPDGANGVGDPAMMNVPPAGSYARSARFEVPLSIGNVQPYTNYVTIATSHAALSSLRFDGVVIGKSKVMASDGKVDLVTIGPISSGSHLVTSDSGVGVMIYGYGFDESYAWAATPNCFTLNSPDTIPPVVTSTSSLCSGTLTIMDSAAYSTGLAELAIDTTYNLSCIFDSTFIPGSGKPKLSMHMALMNSQFPGYATLRVYDLAGNHAFVTVSYTPPSISFDSSALIFVGSTHDTIIVQSLTITNTSSTPFEMSNPHIVSKNSGFTILPGDTSAVPPGGRRTITIQFKGDVFRRAIDQLFIGNSCFSFSLPLTTYPFVSPGYSITSNAFADTRVGDTTLGSFLLTQYGAAPFVVDSVWSGDPNFAFNRARSGGSVPFTVGVGGTHTLWFDFIPKTQGTHTGAGFFHSSLFGTQSWTLYGFGLPPAADVKTSDGVRALGLSVTASPNPLVRRTSGELQLDLTGIPVAEFKAALYDLLGNQIRVGEGVTSSTGMASVDFDVHDLAPGVYFYRVESVLVVQSGRIVVE